MQSPCPLFPCSIDMTALIFQNADKAVLLAKIANAKSQMMRQGRQIKLHINRERFFNGAHGAERFASPKTSAAKHREHDFRLRTPSDPGPERHELFIRCVIEKMRII